MQQSKEPTDPKRPEELEGPAREVALALKAWYREQAILWWRSSGRQSGTCDDGMETLNKGEGYLRPGNYLCCEGHTDDLLCRIVEWEEALQNVDRYFGPGLPDHIIRIAREKYKPNTPAQAAVTPQPSAAVHEMKRDASLQKKQW